VLYRPPTCLSAEGGRGRACESGRQAIDPTRQIMAHVYKAWRPAALGGIVRLLTGGRSQTGDFSCPTLMLYPTVADRGPTMFLGDCELQLEYVNRCMKPHVF
jgi:hypothetical protein